MTNVQAPVYMDESADTSLARAWCVIVRDTTTNKLAAVPADQTPEALQRCNEYVHWRSNRTKRP